MAKLSVAEGEIICKFILGLVDGIFCQMILGLLDRKFPWAQFQIHGIWLYCCVDRIQSVHYSGIFQKPFSAGYVVMPVDDDKWLTSSRIYSLKQKMVTS